MRTLLKDLAPIISLVLMEASLLTAANHLDLTVSHSESLVARLWNDRTVNYSYCFFKLHLVPKLIVKVDTRQETILKEV
jgi:hypothetical protein